LAAFCSTSYSDPRAHLRARAARALLMPLLVTGGQG